MKEKLLNHQQKPRPFGMKTRRLNAVTRILMVLFAMMLFPMTLFSQGAIDPDYYEYDTQAGKFKKVTLNSYNFLSEASYGTDGIGTEGYILETGRTYVSTGGDNFDKRVFINVVVGTEKVVNIILRDGTSVIASKGIDVPSGVTLNIYAQEAGTGVLEAHGCYDDNSTGLGGTGHFYGAAIGGSMSDNAGSSANTPCGTIIIHGGHIKATGANYSAGIGGTKEQSGGNVTIYGGEVIATGGDGDAANVVAMGIGRGSVSNTATSGPSEGSLTINSGVIYYGGTSANPTNQIADGTTRFQYMKTVRSYDLWIGKNMFAAGTQVTEANASDLLGSLASATGTMSFSPYSNTLKLNNAAFGQNIISGLDDLTIEFSGANSIILDGDTGTVIRSTNKDATLTFTHTGTADSLYLRHLNYYDGNNFSIISGFESIDYSTAGLYIKSYSPTKYVSYNTGAGAVLKSLLSAASRISRTSVDGTGGEEITYPCINSATITTTQTYPLWVTGVQVTADNISNILGTATPSVYYDDTNKILTLDGANIDYTGTDRNAVVSGIKELKVLLLNNNIISVKNNYDPTYPNYWRIFNYAFQYYAGTDGELTFVLDEANRSSLGQLTIEKMEDPTSATDPQLAIGYAPFVAYGSIQQSVADLATTNTGSGWIKTTATTPNNSLTLSYSPDNYDLWIAGTRVNSFNAGNVLAGGSNDGKVSYVHDATNNTGTLTLNGMSKDGKIVSNLANLTIELKGENALTGTTGYIESQDATASLTIKKGANDSKLSLTNSTGPSAVGGFASVTLEDIYLSASGCCTYDGSSKAYKYPATDAVGALNVQDLTFTTDVYYPLWVGSTQVSASNMNDLWDDGKASFASGSNTLTLKELSIDSSNGIESALPNLTILLDGNNSINTNTAYHWNPIYSADGNATLTIQKAATATACSLTLSTSAGGIQVVKGFYSVSHPDLDLNVTAGTGTTLDAATTYGATLSISAYPVWIGSKQVNVANAADVLSDGTVSYVHDATNNTGTLTLNNAQLVGDIATSMSNLTIHIKGGCEIRAKSNCIRSSATTPGTLTFTREDAAGDLTLNNMNAVDPNNPSNTKSMSAIKGFSTLAGLPLVTQEPYEIDAYYRLKKTLSSDTSTVDCAWVNADTTYPVWVNGKQVTSENKTNVLEAATATVSFDVDKNTLTLDGANISDSIISDLASLTIGLIGDNSVSKGIRSSKATTSLTIAKDATATGNVSLLVATPYAYAIWGFNSLTYTGFTPYNTDGTLDLTSTISYTSTDRALKNGGSKLDGVKFVSKTDLSASGLSFSMDSKIYSGSAVVLPGTVTMNDGTNNIPLTATSDYTVTGYKDANGNSLTSGAPTDAGSYYATISGEGVYMGTVDVPFTINPITASLSWDATTPLTYDGTPQAPAVSVSNLISGTSCTVTVTGQETNAGTSYTATATALSNNNYQLPKTGLTQAFTINPLTATLSWTNTSFTYDGTAHVPTATVSNLKGTDACTVTVTGAQTDASTTPYTATATALSNANYVLPASVTQTFTIGKIVAALSWSGTSFTYDGTSHVPTATVTNLQGTDVCTVTVTGAQTNASTTPYTATATALSNANYILPATVTQIFTIDPITASLNWSNTTLTYNGSPQQPTAEVSNLISPDVCTVTVTGAQTNAGDYTATAISLSNTNYQLPTTGLTQDFTIKDRTANITFNAGQTYKTFYSAGENLLVPNDVKAYVVTMVSGNTVNLTQISYIHSNVPVLLESSAGATNVKDPNESLPATNLLKYASSGVSTDGNQYVLYSGEFVKATGTIPADRVYLAYSSPVRRLTIERNNSATAIEAVSEEAADSEQWYDMQGRKINKPTKDGLYIKNGKKVVVNNK